MLIKQAVYEKYLKIADASCKALTDELKHEQWRSRFFFPRLHAEVVPNPDYPQKDRLKPYLTNIPATEGASINLWCHPSPLCCGMVELNGSAILPQLVDFMSSAYARQAATLLNVPLEDIHKARFAYAIRAIASTPQGGMFYGAGFRGLMLYTCPVKGSYSEHQKVLTEFGFTPLCTFANPIHEYHEVYLYGCHTPKASQRLDGDKRWADSSTTKAAQSAEAETTSESIKMVVNSVSAAAGGKRRTVERKLIA